jgi:hypothetical protein
MRRGTSWGSPCFALLSIIVLFGGDVLAQNRTGPFAPPVGQSGTTAIYKDSSDIVAWATGCTVQRGLKDTSDPSKGYASAGSPSDATGKAGTGGVVSLGDHGHATLSFESPIRNGPGPDLAVFENSFNNTFLELGFVEVSSNGEDFFRFPSVSLTDTSSQVGSFGDLDATDLYNLAGKYRKNYGTPFDLDELPSHPSLNVDSIIEVRVVDVIGCIQEGMATYDSTGRAVNDPWPTDFNSGGFDLDAVAVIHERNVTGWEEQAEASFGIRYRSGQRSVHLEGSRGPASLRLYDASGRLVHENGFGRTSRVRLPNSLERGVHIIRVTADEGSVSKKVFLR